MSHEKIISTITSAHPDSLLEVALCQHDEGQPTVELRRLSWGEGVGWFRQQTLRLEATEAEDLLLALRGNRSQWRQQPAAPQGRKVIPFPRPAGQSEEGARQTA